jgi:ATPase family associated with various cellular activities (AAA)
VTGATERLNWVDANQRHLSASVARLRWYLELSLYNRESATRDDLEPPPEPPAFHFEGAALEVLARLFGLTTFERDLLLLSAAAELDSGFGALLGKLNNDPARQQPNFSLALSALPGAHWSALNPAASLRRWKLLEVVNGATLTSSALRVDERVLHYLAGVNTLDARLLSMLEPIRGEPELVQSQREIVERVVSAWSPRGGATSGVATVVQLMGADREGRRAMALAATRAFHGDLHALNASLLPSNISELESLATLLRREVALMNLALMIETDDLDATDNTRNGWLNAFLARFSAPLILSGVERHRVPHRAALHLEAPKPNPSEQRALWRSHLGADATDAIEQMTAQFNLSAHGIRAIHLETLPEREASGFTAAHSQTLWRAARAHARPKLDDLAQRLETRANWDDLILPEAQRRILHDITGHVRQRLKVYEHWGFARKNTRGLGISALFAGASGTGKTTAAEILGRELDLDVYRIDLSSTVSKYIGETEKNLRRLFDAAEDGGVILLFDEADAIFGKRSEVKDSHDRYANLEVSYLLQRMEAYSGLAILTSNLKTSIDTAFLRRIRFVVQFPFPDLEERTQMWDRAFPAETPTHDLDPLKLAQLQVAGGNIKNIALNAAFIAADAGESVGMRHVYRAAEAEYAKLEKQLTSAETHGWLEEDEEEST